LRRTLLSQDAQQDQANQQAGAKGKPVIEYEF